MLKALLNLAFTLAALVFSAMSDLFVRLSSRGVSKHITPSDPDAGHLSSSALSHGTLLVKGKVASLPVSREFSSVHG